MSQDTKYELIAKFLTHSLTGKEEEIFKAWIEESESNRKEVEKIQVYWTNQKMPFQF